MRFKIIASFFTAWALSAVGQVESNLFDKILVFAQSNSVRIDCRINPGAQPAHLDLQASIVHVNSGQVLWQGPLGSADRTADKPATLSATLKDLSPLLWEPHLPNLYRLKIAAVQNGSSADEKTVRFGFRTIEIREGQFYLNGRPIFLRGMAINPPDRTIPDSAGESREFAQQYVAFMKSLNVNIIRISTDTSQAWFDVCDEAGMLLYAGRYGSPPGSDAGKQAPPGNFEASLAGYKALFEECVNHPSIILYYLSNELPVSGERGAAYSRFLERAHAELKRWDPTRPYIGNAGYGEGREGDVCDVHRYWGWYYNSFLTYYNLRDKLMRQPLFGGDRNQPLTFTECVGAFTGSSGEFNLVRSKQLGPRLGWIGNTPQPVEDSLAYQSRVLKEATESFRRMRPLNPRLAGLMPFTILFYNWAGVESFDQMRPKPAAGQLRISYQPVLLSWEMWCPQVYAGTRIKSVAHVVNDDERGQSLTNALLRYSVNTKNGRTVFSGTVALPSIPYFGTWKQTLPLDLPPDERTDDYVLCGAIEKPNGIGSTNWTELFIAEPGWGRPPIPLKSRVLVYDPSGRTMHVLARRGVTATPLQEIKDLPRAQTLIIGEYAWNDHLSSKREQLRGFVQSGGRILCMQQVASRFETDWLPAGIEMLRGSANDPAYPPKTRPHAEQSHVNLERLPHPVFLGLDRHRFAFWSDYTLWDQTRPGFPRIYPVSSGFRLTNRADLAKTAILADYDRGLEGIALCEMFAGQGSVILCGLDILNRAGIDPVADRLLANLVAYASSREGHHVLPEVTRPIRWGDLASEQGTVCGSLNGLIINAEWVRGKTQANQKALRANTGSWNMMPGDQFVPKGRNPFGPYQYTTGSSLRATQNNNSDGEGFVLLRVPAGARSMVTKAQNPSDQPARLKLVLNGVESRETIAANSAKTVRTPLPKECDLSIVYGGPKDLVLLETRFE